MNLLKLLTETYGSLKSNYLPYWVLTPARRTLRFISNKYLPVYLNREYKRSSFVVKDLIVSLTSFPARIDDLWKVVECLKRQSVLPQKIILWLSKKQFPDKSLIPVRLKLCVDDLFEIRMVDDDIRSHKKYYYVMREFPECTFITCDDDVFYDPDMIKRLVDTSALYPGCIVANHSSQIRFDIEGKVMPYSTWGDKEPPYAMTDRIQIGVGGVLYPPNSLDKMVLRMDLFTMLTPLADDIWLNCMARLKGTPIVQTPVVLIPLSVVNNSPSLSEVNNGENKNDQQIQNLINYFIKNDIRNVYSQQYDK